MPFSDLAQFRENYDKEAIFKRQILIIKKISLILRAKSLKSKNLKVK